MKGFPMINPIKFRGGIYYQVSEWDRDNNRTGRVALKKYLWQAIRFQMKRKKEKELLPKVFKENKYNLKFNGFSKKLSEFRFCYFILENKIIPAVAIEKDGVLCLFTIYTGGIKYYPIPARVYVERELAEKDL